MSDKYRLVGEDVVPCDDLMVWAALLESEDRIVARTKVRGMEVSTVFLGLDYRFGDGPPLVFETLVFGGPLDGRMDRWSTWDEAERGHARMVRRVIGIGYVKRRTVKKQRARQCADTRKFVKRWQGRHDRYWRDFERLANAIREVRTLTGEVT